jgi:hypothetical protein
MTFSPRSIRMNNRRMKIVLRTGMESAFNIAAATHPGEMKRLIALSTKDARAAMAYRAGLKYRALTRMRRSKPSQRRIVLRAVSAHRVTPRRRAASRRARRTARGRPSSDGPAGGQLGTAASHQARVRADQVARLTIAPGPDRKRAFVRRTTRQQADPVVRDYEWLGTFGAAPRPVARGPPMVGTCRSRDTT